MNHLLRALNQFSEKSVLVIGDVFLDEYLVGRPSRVSREAPVLVLEYDSRFVLPGGGSNPANNVAALGAQARQVGVIGDDEAGRQLCEALRNNGVDVSGMVSDCGRPTTTKTRLVADGFLQYPQQVARLDKQDRTPISDDVEKAVIEAIERQAGSVDAILLSDYKTGVLNDNVIMAAISSARKYGKLVTVDSQGDLHKFLGFSVVKCNKQEAEAFLGRRLKSEADFEDALVELKKSLEAGAVVITRGPDGMSAMGEDNIYHHVAASNRSEVFDVTGAGDTVIAVLTLALASGAPLADSALLSNYAAGEVVRKLGNATTTIEELASAVLRNGRMAPERRAWSSDSKIVDLRDLTRLRQEMAEAGSKVVFTNGSFDLLHAGHVRYLQTARSMGDCLIVGLNSDRSVKSYKGPDRPVVGERDRAELLAALACVDYVVLFDEPTAEELVRELKPDIYVKGGDYTLGNASSDDSRKELPEAKVVLGYGGTVQIAPLLAGLSTTELIRRIKGQGTKEA